MPLPGEGDFCGSDCSDLPANIWSRAPGFRFVQGEVGFNAVVKRYYMDI